MGIVFEKSTDPHCLVNGDHLLMIRAVVIHVGKRENLERIGNTVKRHADVGSVVAFRGQNFRDN